MTELGVPNVVCMDARHARAAMVAIVTHRMWVDGTTFRWGAEKMAAMATA